MVYSVLALVVALLPGARWRSLGAAGLVLVALGAAGDAIGAGGADTTFTTINEILAGAGGALIAAAAVQAFRQRAVIVRTNAPVYSPAGCAGRLDLLLLGGLGVSLLAPNLIVTTVGTAMAIAAGARRTMREGKRLWLVPLLISAALFVAALVMYLVLTGPLGTTIRTLSDAPVSPAAERTLALLFGIGGLLVAALPPLHRAPWGLFLTPVAAIILTRVMIPGLPGGMEAWRPAAMGLLVAGFGWLALRREWIAATAVGGLAALWSATPDVTYAGGALVLWAWLADRFPWLEGGESASRWLGLLSLPPLLALRPALEGALQGEVLISTVAALLLFGALLLDARHRTSVGTAPLY
ncbi:MAG: hypothetical protein HOP28_09655 [Gemmatimonadales bacterium]|nr:hypothetical protein [Gemmatimonadales bacterium]